MKKYLSTITFIGALVLLGTFAQAEPKFNNNTQSKIVDVSENTSRNRGHIVINSAWIHQNLYGNFLIVNLCTDPISFDKKIVVSEVDDRSRVYRATDVIWGQPNAVGPANSNDTQDASGRDCFTVTTPAPLSRYLRFYIDVTMGHTTFRSDMLTLERE